MKTTTRIGLALAVGLMAVGGPGCGGGAARPVIAQCVLTSDCAAPLVCAQGYCVGQCSVSRDCPGDQRCIIVSEGGTACQPPPKRTCAYNSDCAPLFCAVDLECRNQCLSSADCLSGQLCTATSKVCVDPTKDAPHYDPATNELLPAMDAGAPEAADHRGVACAYNDDCWPLLCAPDRLCHPRCQTAADCLTGEKCTSGSKVCFDPASDGGLYDPAINDFVWPAPPDAGADRLDATDSTDGGDVRQPAPWHLWVAAVDDGSRTPHIYGYAPDQIQAAGSDQPEIDLTFPSELTSTLMNPTITQLASDPQGNLWVRLAGTVQSDAATFRYVTTPLLMRIGPAQQRATGTVTPEAILELPGATQYVAFSAGGDLWVNMQGSVKTPVTQSRLAASDIAGLSVTPSEIAPRFYGLYPCSGPIVFDGAGNLYTQAVGTPLVRFDAAQVAGDGLSSETPAWTSTSVASSSPSDLVFMPSGQLLLIQSTDIYRFSKQQIAGTGAGDTTAPEAHLTVTVGTWRAAQNTALDPEGNLLLSDFDHMVVVKVSAADLAKSGTASVAGHIVVRPPSARPGQLTTLVVH